MILGKITGKSTTNNFTFQVSGNAKKFQYVQIPYLDDYALAQIIELEKDSDKTIAYCNILGYKKNKYFNKYYSNEDGINSRLDEIQAGILNFKL